MFLGPAPSPKAVNLLVRRWDRPYKIKHWNTNSIGVQACFGMAM